MLVNGSGQDFSLAVTAIAIGRIFAFAPRLAPQRSAGRVDLPVWAAEWGFLCPHLACDASPRTTRPTIIGGEQLGRDMQSCYHKEWIRHGAFFSAQANSDLR